jgi:hypothetical protein
MYVWVYVCMYVCMYASISCKHVCMYARVYVTYIQGQGIPRNTLYVMSMIINVLHGTRLLDIPNNGLVVNRSRHHEFGIVGPGEIVDVGEVTTQGQFSVTVYLCQVVFIVYMFHVHEIECCMIV